MDAASSAEDGAVPTPGDISVCLNCGQILVFGDDLIQRMPTEEELAKIKASKIWPGLQSVQISIRMRGRIHD
jgi:hypothetical protein